MKHLQEFINEQIEVQIKESCKSVTFDFTDLEGAEDTLKSFEDKEGCQVEDNKLTVSVSDKLDSVQDILQQYGDKLQKSSKATNNESYAQKVNKFNSKVEELNNAIEEINSDDSSSTGDDSSSSESE